MSSTLVIYRSKYGATKQYAKWLASELQADLKEAKQVKKQDLDSYETIIYGGGIYVEHIHGVSLITKHLSRLKDKRVIVFGVGLAIPNETLTKTLQETVLETNFFYLRGSLNFTRLTLMDKILMLAFKRILKKLPNPTQDQLTMLEAYHTPVNYVEKSNLDELVQFIKGDER